MLVTGLSMMVRDSDQKNVVAEEEEDEAEAPAAGSEPVVEVAQGFSPIAQESAQSPQIAQDNTPSQEPSPVVQEHRQEIATLVQEFVPTLRPSRVRTKMIDWYTKMPAPRGLVFGAMVFYIGLGLNSFVIITAFLEKKWTLFVMVLCAVVLPGIVQGLNTFVMTRLLNPDTPFKTRATEALYHALCLGRGVECYRYVQGRAPLSWSAVCKDRLGSIALCDVPAAVANIMELLSMDLRRDTATLSLVMSTLVIFVTAPAKVKLCHGMTGEPGNCQKYRYWDLEVRPILNIVTVFILDATQVVYRILLFALLAKFIGFFNAVVFVFMYQAMAFRFLKMGLQAIPAIKNPSSLAFTAAIEMVAFDYVWLEPVPAYKYYVENCFAMRFWQAFMGFLLIGLNWEKSIEWNQQLFWFLFICCIVSATLYFGIYAIFVFYYSAERSRTAYDTGDEFFQRMTNRKVQLNEERRLSRVEFELTRQSRTDHSI